MGNDIANQLDEFFEDVVIDKIADVLEEIDGGILYSSQSPYSSGDYFSIGGHYMGGNLVPQYVTDAETNKEPSIVTTFEYGYDLTYWKPKPNNANSTEPNYTELDIPEICKASLINPGFSRR